MQHRLFKEIKALNPSFTQPMRFPEKKWFFNRSADFIERRRAELELFIGKITKNRSLLNSRVFRDFIF